jgi:NADPH:quinone reductase-like Zn-dependent oxidoreductase
MDLLQREGKYPLPPQASKDILGVEFSGVVEDAGQQGDGAQEKAGKASVDKWAKGDEVFGLAYGVSLSSYSEMQAGEEEEDGEGGRASLPELTDGAGWGCRAPTPSISR